MTTIKRYHSAPRTQNMFCVQHGTIIVVSVYCVLSSLGKNYAENGNGSANDKKQGRHLLEKKDCQKCCKDGLAVVEHCYFACFYFGKGIIPQSVAKASGDNADVEQLKPVCCCNIGERGMDRNKEEHGNVQNKTAKHGKGCCIEWTVLEDKSFAENSVQCP